MPTPDTSPQRVLHFLKRVFPRDVRERHGSEMLAFWSLQRREARYSGAVGRVRFMKDVVLDAVVSGLRARRLETGRWEWAQMKGMFTDIRDGFRSLRGAPSYTVVTMLTLALGISATSAIFTVVYGVLLSPLPYPNASELVQISRVTAGDGVMDDVAWPDFRDWRDRATGFTGMAAYTEGDAAFAWGTEAETLDGYYVTRDFFDVMGVSLLRGRTFDETEDTFGGADAMVLSYGLWQSRFAGDAGVIGRSVTVNGASVTVVGIAPAGFGFPNGDTEFWRPLQHDQLLADAGLPVGTRRLSFLQIVARLGPTTMEAAQEQLVGLVTAIDLEVGQDADEVGLVQVRSLAEATVGEVRTTLMFLLGSVALVLLVACANVAGLAISRAVARERELAVRVSMGASRGRIVRQFLAETVIVALGAGVIGAALVVALTTGLRLVAPPELPRLDDVRVGPAVLLFSAGLTLVVGALCGVLPAWRASRIDVIAGLASASRGSSGSRASIRPQQFLVVAQVAVSVVLLSAAALLGHSFAKLMTVDRGFDSERVIVASVQPSAQRYDKPEAVDRFYQTLLERVRALPGVKAATTTYSPPLADNLFSTRIAREGEETDDGEHPWAGTIVIRADYFETLDVPLVAGRDFTSGDRLGRPLVAIVNQALADQFWPGEDPLGKRFSFAGGISGAADSFSAAFFPKEAYTVVGVAGNVRRNRLDEAPAPEYYRPHAQITWGFQFLLVRTIDEPGPVMQRLRAEVWAVDPTVPVRTLQMLNSTVAASEATPRFRMLLVVGFAVVASLLAMVGLYAVMAMAVQRRVREMGIRLALGAQRAQVLTRVLRQGLVLVAIGMGLGLGGAYLARETMAAMLFGIGPGDPLTYLGVLMLITVIAVGACYLPARRASLVDPTVSLRDA